MTTATTETESPKPVRLNKANVTKALKDAVKARGRDYVYADEFGSACYYVVDQKPACLVGEVLATSFGIPIDVLEPLDTTAEDVLDTLQHDGVLTCTPTAVDMLMRAQRVQDEAESWGEALDSALRM